MAEHGPPDLADPVHGVPRLNELWNVELDEAPVALALSPKQQLLAVATVDDSIQLLDVASGKVAHTLTGHSGGTNRLAFLSGNSLVSVGEDGTARLWNVARAACLHEMPVDAEGADRAGQRGHCVNHLTIAPGAKSFACAAGRLVTIFTLGSTAQQPPSKRVLGPLESTVESLRFDRRGNLLATYNNGVSYWDFTRSQDEQELPLPAPGAMLCGDVTPSGDYIVAGCHDATVHIYHFKQKSKGGVEMEEMSCGGYESKVTCVDFNPQGDRMASSGGDKCTVWNFSGAPTGTMPVLTVGHLGNVTCQSWQPDMDGYLATGARDGRLQIHDVDDAAPMRPDMPFICQPGAIGVTEDDEVTALVFARDGLLYSGHISGAVRKWELPLASSEEEEEEQAPTGVPLPEQAQQQQEEQQPDQQQQGAA
ncbi:WD40 subgroup [Chlorella sorokiniana]|uniref:WD40 subgroup n=1 Tax=Chlorella sorokiniana TaxID=3076 RepID=A0A2P6TPL7_CHLSO|nr:WD40 subgroup [Chlorella sorokiniana]|eukprot:PRW55973.1 WD40 subgroup [Chlorella sorokiniana]